MSPPGRLFMMRLPLLSQITPIALRSDREYVCPVEQARQAYMLRGFGAPWKSTLEAPGVPFIATLVWRHGPIWPANLAHFFPAANTGFCVRKNSGFSHPRWLL